MASVFAYTPLLLLRATALDSMQSLTSHTTTVLSLPPVTSMGLSSSRANAEARIMPSCALKVAIVS